MTEALQDRRRHQTEREIREAALALFEERGVDGTTVEDIAHAAGVSSRTVFRYAVSKERAALLPDPVIERTYDEALTALRPGEPLVPQLTAVSRDSLAAIENGGRDGAGRDALRQWRLVAREPKLLLAAIAVDEERLARAQATLTETLGLDPLTARVALVATSAVVRVALDQWAADPAGPGLAETYDAACESLRRESAG
ncbi:TetR family transcriptional regulator [Nocardioides sp. dk4132]|uniref:TetR/AcrR family transcriptional regulator n=1 Tax=unclassified Nocardioides TaxID=2615069 RepID=UPI0012971DDC|nr:MULTISPECIES: TetR/AcrR family transcriptional regulator [unclassified Nocardioides]MQW77837.1 TetR family transcriptional regulator [Nocardioides sp. dk4132]QGA08229.1 TetR family transcriptional regulator [Nocardioides sp. dk884]